MIILVQNLRKRENVNYQQIINEIIQTHNLTYQCIMMREYLSPQSTYMEKIVKKYLHLEDCKDVNTGDGCKNNFNYEIKVSVHSKNSKFNFVQIRPDHKIDFYILIGYNIHYDNDIGRAYIFKVPSDDINNLILEFGSYAHGSKEILGNITKENLKGRNCEYALRCNPNSKKGNNFKLWNRLLEYEIEYNPELF